MQMKNTPNDWNFLGRAWEVFSFLVSKGSAAGFSPEHPRIGCFRLLFGIFKLETDLVIQMQSLQETSSGEAPGTQQDLAKLRAAVC